MNENYFYGHGKLLLTGEYFVLDGAQAIALPTKLGQQMHVKYRPSNNPRLFWKSYDDKKKCWFETSFELWHFECLSEETEEVLVLQNILREARKLNIHFLRDAVDVYVKTVLEFPIDWGLGSSSTLIYNIAQWAYVSPFELHTKSFNGSGYDIACAQSMGPITFEKNGNLPRWGTINFNPVFKDSIYFVYLNQKMNSRDGIQRYQEVVSNKDMVIPQINKISKNMLECFDLNEFEELVIEHERLISHHLDLPCIKETTFQDYWGTVKSLGAWGGDFVMATSSRDINETKKYFKDLGYSVCLTFDELILQNFQKFGEILNQENCELITASH
jgi:mevalonate kinase